jgi:hypothetical protein
MEVSRALKFWDSPWAAQIEYNGGTYVNDAWLTGTQYTWNNADYSKIFTLQGLFKHIKAPEGGDAQNGFQLTGVWALQLAWKVKLPFRDLLISGSKRLVGVHLLPTMYSLQSHSCGIILANISLPVLKLN